MTTLAEVRSAYSAAGFPTHQAAQEFIILHVQNYAPTQDPQSLRECLLALPELLTKALQTQYQYTGRQQFDSWMENLLVLSGFYVPYEYTCVHKDDPRACRTK